MPTIPLAPPLYVRNTNKSGFWVKAGITLSLRNLKLIVWFVEIYQCLHNYEPTNLNLKISKGNQKSYLNHILAFKLNRNLLAEVYVAAKVNWWLK